MYSEGSFLLFKGVSLQMYCPCGLVPYTFLCFFAFHQRRGTPRGCYSDCDELFSSCEAQECLRRSMRSSISPGYRIQH